MTARQDDNTFRKRYCGILLHPTSLPGPYGIGDLGRSARDFVDFLYDAGQTLWECLPLGPTGFGDSPYQPFSAFAGQPLLISPDLLRRDGLLNDSDLADVPDFDPYNVQYGPVITYKTHLLHTAFDNFSRSEDTRLHDSFDRFCRREKYWLRDYALFMSLKDENGGRSWYEWKDSQRLMNAQDRAAAAKKYRRGISYYEFVQFIFFGQWADLKAYANSKGISVAGDIPLYVSPDSADVWACPGLFRLDADRFPTDVAGVPPDYFSATGQLWGNPLYDWPAHKKEGYSWWINRIRNQLGMFDYLRIDHFRGLDAYWSVPGGETTAVSGKWVKGPGASLFKAVQKELGPGLPIWAEDLGTITPSVRRLRDSFGFPGMKVLQFAFDSDEESEFLPYLYPENCICYTGTHDNDTTVGWYLSADDKCRERVKQYMNTEGLNIHWDFIRTAISSPARYVIIPLQDLFGYGGDCRMNTPSTPSGNWTWRYTNGALTPQLAAELKKICQIYGRDRARMEKQP